MIKGVGNEVRIFVSGTLFYFKKGEERMLKNLCEMVEKTGDLRKAISKIDFNKICDDPEQAAKTRMELMERAGELAALQHDLIDLMKEV